MYNNDGYIEERQGNKYLNFILLVGAIIGAVVGFFVGEVIILLLKNNISEILLVGIYFAQLTFFIFFAVLICEKIDPRLNSRIWTADHWKDSLKRLPLMSLVVFFALGCGLQFLYGLTENKKSMQKADDYIICIDNSGSMSISDAPKDRFKAVISFVEELDETNNIAILLFSHKVEEIVPLSKANDTLRVSIRETLERLESNGGTNIQSALETAADISIEDNRKAMVILISDGESSVNTRKITDIYNTNGLVLNTIECYGHQLWRSSLLLNLATSTGGMNYQIPEMNQLTGTFTKILTGEQASRNLLDYRYGYDRGSTLFMVLRILFIAIIGAITCVALAVMLYNTRVMKQLWICKVITGILAGLSLEFGLYHFWPAPTIRFIMVFLIGLLISFFCSSIVDISKGSGEGLASRRDSQW